VTGSSRYITLMLTAAGLISYLQLVLGTQRGSSVAGLSSARMASLVRMNLLTWTLVAVGVFLLLYAALVLALIIAGRRESARALAGFIPDCIVLCGRLLGDPRVPRRKKALLVALTGYLALPFDLVPDFIPVAGQLDDVVIVALVLRTLVRGGGEPLVREHWPGPEKSLALVLRLAA
jgi:uncharacterized membrane protein YkvA (DUF1232 family)